MFPETELNQILLLSSTEFYFSFNLFSGAFFSWSKEPSRKRHYSFKIDFSQFRRRETRKFCIVQYKSNEFELSDESNVPNAKETENSEGTTPKERPSFGPAEEKTRHSGIVIILRDVFPGINQIHAHRLLIFFFSVIQNKGREFPSEEYNCCRAGRSHDEMQKTNETS